MGKHTGLRHVGAKGKQTALSRSQAEAALDGVAVSAKELAQKHVKASILTLAKAQRTKLTPRQQEAGDELAPWPTRRQAAKDIVEIAYGRPETRDSGDRTAAGLTVVINQLTTGEDALEKVVSGIQMAKNVQKAIDVTAEPDSVPSATEVSHARVEKASTDDRDGEGAGLPFEGK